MTPETDQRTLFLSLIDRNTPVNIQCSPKWIGKLGKHGFAYLEDHLIPKVEMYKDFRRSDDSVMYLEKYEAAVTFLYNQLKKKYLRAMIQNPEMVLQSYTDDPDHAVMPLGIRLKNYMSSFRDDIIKATPVYLILENYSTYYNHLHLTPSQELDLWHKLRKFIQNKNKYPFHRIKQPVAFLIGLTELYRAMTNTNYFQDLKTNPDWLRFLQDAAFYSLGINLSEAELRYRSFIYILESFFGYFGRNDPEIFVPDKIVAILKTYIMYFEKQREYNKRIGYDWPSKPFEYLLEELYLYLKKHQKHNDSYNYVLSYLAWYLLQKFPDRNEYEEDLLHANKKLHRQFKGWMLSRIDLLIRDPKFPGGISRGRVDDIEL